MVPAMVMGGDVLAAVFNAGCQVGVFRLRTPLYSAWKEVKSPSEGE
jgi:hypothetical protein